MGPIERSIQVVFKESKVRVIYILPREEFFEVPGYVKYADVLYDDSPLVAWSVSRTFTGTAKESVGVLIRFIAAHNIKANEQLINVGVLEKNNKLILDGNLPVKWCCSTIKCMEKIEEETNINDMKVNIDENGEKEEYIEGTEERDKLIKPNFNIKYMSEYGKVQEILDKHKRVVYNKHLGCAKGYYHTIETTGRPVVEKTRPINNPEARAGLDKDLDKLERTRVIEAGSGAYASNLVLVKKSDGTYRVCVDFRRLNAQTVRDQFPLPNIQVILENMSKGRIFTKLDLRSGFH